MIHRLLPAAVLAVILAAAPIAPAWSGEVRLLTLEQAIELAARSNRGVARAQQGQRQAEGFFLAERAGALPRLGAAGALSSEDDRSSDNARRERASAALQLEQALYTSGRLTATIRAAELNIAGASEQLRASQQQALRDTALAFFDVLLARELHAAFADELAQKNRRLDEARRRLALGLATDYDLLVAEVAAANARPEVLRTDTLVRSRRDRLGLALGIDEPVDAAGTLEVSAQQPPDYQSALATARERRPELRGLQARVAAAAELLTAARAGDRPRLDFSGSYGWKGLNERDNERDGAAWQVGLALNWPFFDGQLTRGRAQQADAVRLALQLDELQLLDSVAVEVREALDRLQVATELVEALGATVGQAEKLLQMAEKGYQFGVKIRLEVDDAEVNLRQARTGLALARRDCLAAAIDLALAMGTLGEETFPGLPVPPVSFPETR